MVEGLLEFLRELQHPNDMGDAIIIMFAAIAALVVVLGVAQVIRGAMTGNAEMRKNGATGILVMAVSVLALTVVWQVLGIGDMLIRR